MWSLSKGDIDQFSKKDEYAAPHKMFHITGKSVSLYFISNRKDRASDNKWSTKNEIEESQRIARKSL
jgi:hypothetical protein